MSAATPTTGSTLRQWSTDAVAPSQKLDYWVGAICEAFLEMDFDTSEAAPFKGTLTHADVGPLSFNQVQAASSDVYRTQAGIARGTDYPLYLITDAENSWRVRQAGQNVALRPGDSVLVDSAQCYELHFPVRVKNMSIQLPRSWVGHWLAYPAVAAPRVIARDVGWGQALSALCVQFARDPALVQGYPEALLTDQMGAMLAASLEPAQHGTNVVTRGLTADARRVMQSRLAEPGLTATVVASMIGASVRTLHRSFAVEKISFAGTLRGLRLAQAAHLLAQARLQHVTSAEIGRRCGFADASHFVREFHGVHGVTPARWRRLRLAS
jgi:AraC family transcriptional regulator, positive regulator of tynA and feaB